MIEKINLNIYKTEFIFSVNVNLSLSSIKIELNLYPFKKQIKRTTLKF